MNGPLLNFEVSSIKCHVKYQCVDFTEDEARHKLNIVNIVKILQILLAVFMYPRTALMLGLSLHPGRPLSSDLAPALVITVTWRSEHTRA